MHTNYKILPTADGAVSKSYYTLKGVAKTIGDAVSYCEDNDMELLSPQSQSEYDNLQNIFKDWTVKSFQDFILVGGYGLNNEWFDGGKKLKYVPNYSTSRIRLQTNQLTCLLLTKDGERNVTSIDMPCHAKYAFACEYNPKRLSVQVKQTNAELSKFLKQVQIIVDLEGDKTIATKLYLSKEDKSVGALGAKLFCRSFGMELFVAKTDEDVEMLQNILRNMKKYFRKVYIGVSELGQENSWYDVNNGKNVSLTIPETANNENYLMLKKDNENYEVTSGSDSISNHVFCQQR